MGKKEVSKELVVGVFPDCLVSFCRGKDTQFNGFMHGLERLRDVDGLLWLSSKRDWGNRKYIYINLLHSYVWSDGIKKGTWERERERERFSEQIGSEAANATMDLHKAKTAASTNSSI